MAAILLVLVQFRHSVVSNSLWPLGLHQARLPCPSPTPGDGSNSLSIESVMPSYHLILHHPLLLLPSIFPSIRVFSNELLYASDGQSIGASATQSVLPMDVQGWFPLGLTGLILLLSKGLSRVFSKTTILKHKFLGAQFSLWSNSHIWTWLMVIALTIQTFVSKVLSLLFNMLSRLVTAFFPRREPFFNFMTTVTFHSDFGAQENKICQFPFVLHILLWSDGTRCHDLSVLNVEF